LPRRKKTRVELVVGDRGRYAEQSNQCPLSGSRLQSRRYTVNRGFAHKRQRRRRRMKAAVEHPGRELFEANCWPRPTQRNASPCALRLTQVGRELLIHSEAQVERRRGWSAVVRHKWSLVGTCTPQSVGGPLTGLGKGSHGTRVFALETSPKMRGVWLQRHRPRGGAPVG